MRMEMRLQSCECQETRILAVPLTQCKSGFCAWRHLAHQPDAVLGRGKLDVQTIRETVSGAQTLRTSENGMEVGTSILKLLVLAPHAYLFFVPLFLPFALLLTVLEAKTKLTGVSTVSAVRRATPTHSRF